MMTIRCIHQNTEKQFVSSANTVLLGRRIETTDRELDLKPDKHVSRRHARILFRNDSYFLEDLGSRHGTYLNGVRLPANERIEVNPGDKIQIGNTLLQIEFDSPTYKPEAPPQVTELISVLSAQQPATDLILPKGNSSENMIKVVRRHLKVLYAMSELPGMVSNVEELNRAVIDYIAEAIPKAHTLGLIRVQPDESLRLVASKTRTGEEPRYSETQPQTVMQERQSAIWTIDDGDMSKSAIEYQIQSAMYAPLIWDDASKGALFVNSTSSTIAFTDDDLRLLTALANQASIFMRNQELQAELQREEVIRSNLLRHFSPQIAGEFMAADNELRHRGKLMEDVSILVADVRGFSVYSASLHPEEVMKILNTMLDALVPIIFEFDGTIDKYTGDGILAVFGSPHPDSEHRRKAIKAALAMQAAMADLAIPFEIGIGIHSGEVVHGFLGAAERIEYTVIGDTVNKASRHCDGADPGEVLISEATYTMVQPFVKAEARMIRGKHPDREADMQAYRILEWRKRR